MQFEQHKCSFYCDLVLCCVTVNVYLLVVQPIFIKHKFTDAHFYHRNTVWLTNYNGYIKIRRIELSVNVVQLATAVSPILSVASLTVSLEDSEKPLIFSCCLQSQFIIFLLVLILFGLQNSQVIRHGLHVVSLSIFEAKGLLLDKKNISHYISSTHSNSLLKFHLTVRCYCPLTFHMCVCAYICLCNCASDVSVLLFCFSCLQCV